MAEEYKNNRHEQEYKVGNEGGVESQDRGVFDFLGKKEEKKPQEEEVIATEFEKVKVSESDYQPHHVVQEEHKDEEEKKHSTLLEKLHRSGSNSSSSSDEEEGEDEEKKKKKKEKKGLKEKIHEKISGEKEEETSIPVEKYEESHAVGEGCQGEEKKGFLDKIKEKLPGQHKKTEEVSPPQHQHDQYQSEYAPTVVVSHHESEGEAKEKKGFLDKIKEKLPGYHSSKTEEDKEKEKEKEKDSATHY